MKKSFWEGFLLFLHSVDFCPCSEVWAVCVAAPVPFPGNSRGFAGMTGVKVCLFVCLFDSLVLAVHCSDCADQSLLLHVLWNPWEGSEEPRQPWKGQTRVTRLWKRVQNPQPASTGWRPSPENLCSFLPVSLGFSMCCSALLPPCGCTDSPPLLLHWALQGWLSKLSWVGCA